MSFVGKWYQFGRLAAFDDGLRAQERGDWETAASHYRRVKESSRAAPDLIHQASMRLADMLGRSARAQWEKGDLRTAREQISEAVNEQPGFADLRLLKSEIALASNDPVASRAEAEEALRINPSFDRARIVKAAALVLGGKEEEGFAALKAIDFLPPAVDAAVKDHDAGEREKALLRLRQVDFNQEPGSVAALIADGDKAVRESDWQAARDLYARALEDAPRYADLHAKLGQVFLELGEVGSAASCFTHSVEINPLYAEAHALRGVAAKRGGDAKTAKEHFRKALEINPNQSIALEEISRR